LTDPFARLLPWKFLAPALPPFFERIDGPAGGAANFVQIAILTGMSALAGTEADLLANGNLIAHV
jgi:hypothetical protein